uniref:Uncharacterized protein n=1 Tax=Timema poppense TaxID=170557 RepID=A0A7R9H7T3_TIMPO|nr:unnamed protein product [Timema poppensis]
MLVESSTLSAQELLSELGLSIAVAGIMMANKKPVRKWQPLTMSREHKLYLKTFERCGDQMCALRSGRENACGASMVSWGNFPLRLGVSWQRQFTAELELVQAFLKESNRPPYQGFFPFEVMVASEFFEAPMTEPTVVLG